VLAQSLIVASAAILFLFGSLHAFYTFASNKFSPRDPELEQRLKAVSPVISRQTTMWKAWVGFNASHSLGAILFGAVYIYLSLYHALLLFQSYFLLGLGVIVLIAYLIVAKLYWFSAPLRGIALALGFYLAAIVASRL